MNETTDGTLLGGKISYRQFASGHRTGFEPVLLAAAVDARPGEFVLEAGSGAGAALLCLGRRRDNLRGIGVEIVPKLAQLANENFINNSLNDFSCLVADTARLPFAGIFDHAMANPPWFDAGGTRSPDAARALAHQAPAGLLVDWIAGLAVCLKPRGTIYLILPAASLSAAITALRHHRFGAVTLFPLWPRAGQAAKQFIVSATRMRQRPDQLLPGLILHDENGISPAANAVLRDGAPLIPVTDREKPRNIGRSRPARGHSCQAGD